MDSEEELMIISAECWNCDMPMLIALVGDEGGNFGYGPEEFTKNEQRLATKYGVLLKEVASKTAEMKYLANVCRHCNSFIGQYFYYAHYYTPALYGHYKYEIVR